jgi:Ribbon-helix-helix protein, copG family
MTRSTISFTREGMKLIQEAAKRQGSSVSQFIREAALMRATMAADDNPYPMRALAAQLQAISDQGYALAETALKVAEERGLATLRRSLPPKLTAWLATEHRESHVDLVS